LPILSQGSKTAENGKISSAPLVLLLAVKASQLMRQQVLRVVVVVVVVSNDVQEITRFVPTDHSVYGK
jgi:hypothetical protein